MVKRPPAQAPRRARPLAAALATLRRRRPDAAIDVPALSLPTGQQIHELESANVDVVRLALESTGLRHFLIPRPEPRNIHIGLARQDAGILLSRLAQSPHPVALSWQDGPGWRTSDPATAASALSDDVDILWVHHGFGARTAGDVKDASRAVGVELWSRDVDGNYGAPTANPYASRVNMQAAQVEARARTGQELLTFPAFATPDIAEVGFTVDAVYLWVDDSDPVWRGRRDEALSQLSLDPEHESISPSRFRQHDELRYSLRSLSMFAPWIRHVYLVTDQQRPAWLNAECPRLTVVDHQELMGAAGKLPTYNSHALASRLHHIEGLSEHYLYLNDDVFFGRRTGAELWFGGNGQPRFHNTTTKVDPADLHHLSPHAAARNHTLGLIRDLTGRARRRNIQHGPHPMRRALLQQLEDLLPEEFARTWSSQVRSDTDIVIEWLHNQYGYCTGQAQDGRGVRYDYITLSDPDIAGVLDEVGRNMSDVLCINDGGSASATPERDQVLRRFLQAQYPTPSEFERGSSLES